MRVIAGSAKGRKLKTLEGMEVRPTTDKVKEAVFSSIQFDLPGAEVLDLFSGSGQMGIEALSRGANHAVFVDRAANSLRVTRFPFYNLRQHSLILPFWIRRIARESSCRFCRCWKAKCIRTELSSVSMRRD